MVIKEAVSISADVKPRPVVYIISDSIGETAELVVRAAASQFNGGNVEIRRVPYVNDTSEIPEIVEEASHFNSLIAYTLVLPILRETIAAEAKKHGVITVDIMGPTLDALTQLEGRQPKLEPGLVRKIDQEYFRKVEAIEFAVKYDDGKDPRGITRADLVIIGVSRTSKTPLCMYLAHKSIKVANVPLVPEVAPPEEIFSLPHHKVIGLTISPSQLNEIRQERLKSLGLTSHADYASMERILKELDYAKKVMEKAGCPIIDVTNKAVEETASRVMEIYYKGERLGR
ncbi:putative pyruvate, phosphate dikinase regulatory protein [Sporotomaculum syntrophicum]|uniref:Putative pyruvate, phosphate dikinase regulatory protein n=1 Tax=Sporotomaculum syntrophicum TaxID=182264 RepID=A0A9D2WN57_9FIRM|nr:pyruvate, water dikinase regulatory protein [Sporotomaculum syntrophicum]KAF1084065.1 putative pyruvate, phosphate dikinase regulatory protein [Sporotomaculum syntrophicum]